MASGLLLALFISATSLGFSTAATTTRPEKSPSRLSPTSTPTLNCQQNIPTNGPDPEDLAVELSKGMIDICKADFSGSGDSTHQTFNIINLEIRISRASPSQKLKNCTDGLSDIVNTCIRHSADYGGIWELDGEVYNIINPVFPNNPIVLPSSMRPPPSSSTTPPQSTPTPNPDGTNIVSFERLFCEWVIDTAIARQQRVHQHQR
jgi:hypothetical protein